MRRSGAFMAIGLLFGIAYALITPPFEVPDEVGHYWRASSIAYGHIATQRPQMPRGFGVIVYALWTPDRTQHMTSERLRLARGVMLQPETRGPVGAHAFYSPAAYIPQIAAAFLSRVTRLRPFYGCYLGRIATAIASILIIAGAGAVAPEFRDHIHAVALLPMSLFLFGSWSADAMTIAAAFLTSSVIIAARTTWLIPSAFWLALCKPAYAMLALPGLFASRRRVLLIAAIAGGSLLSVWMTLSTAVAFPRSDVPIDAHAQWQFIRDRPVRFMAVLIDDLHANGWDYARAMTGRFGLYDVQPPSAVSTVILILLVAIALFNGPALPLRLRVAISVIAIAIFT